MLIKPISDHTFTFTPFKCCQIYKLSMANYVAIYQWFMYHLAIPIGCSECNLGHENFVRLSPIHTYSIYILKIP